MRNRKAVAEFTGTSWQADSNMISQYATGVQSQGCEARGYHRYLNCQSEWFSLIPSNKNRSREREYNDDGKLVNEVPDEVSPDRADWMNTIGKSFMPRPFMAIRSWTESVRPLTARQCQVQTRRLFSIP